MAVYLSFFCLIFILCFIGAMFTTNETGKWVALIVLVVALIEGFSLVYLTNHVWKEWALENNYAHYDQKTGKIVYER